MKHFIYIVFIATILMSCSSNADNNQVKSSGDKKVDNKELKKHFMPYFTGAWMEFMWISILDMRN